MCVVLLLLEFFNFYAVHNESFHSPFRLVPFFFGCYSSHVLSYETKKQNVLYALNGVNMKLALGHSCA